MADGKPSKSPKRARERRLTVEPSAEPPVAVDVAASAAGASPSGIMSSADAVPPGPAIAEDGASLEADRVDLRMSAVGRVESSDLSVARGAVGAARSDNLVAGQSAIGAVMADHAEVDRSYVRSILARQIQLDRSAARIVIAADVNARQTAVMFLVARRVAGEVKVLFDWRGALAFGAAAGFVLALLSRRRRRGS